MSIMKKPNRILQFIFILPVILLSCNGQKIESTSNNIVGKWQLTVKQVNYPSLIFNTDSTAIFNSMGDTLYRYKYYINESELFLKDINGKITKDKILKLDKDSLIFETLADNKQVQRYKRK